MFKVKLSVSSLYYRAKKLLFTTIIGLTVISISTNLQKAQRQVSLSAEEEIVNFALDHNQCLGHGYSPESSSYEGCMDKLKQQRQSIVSL